MYDILKNISLLICAENARWIFSVGSSHKGRFLNANDQEFGINTYRNRKMLKDALYSDSIFYWMFIEWKVMWPVSASIANFFIISN